MRIVVLDGYTLNPGDLNWDEFQVLGRCTIHDRTPADQTLERAAGHEIVLTNKVALSSTHFDGLPQLKYIGVLATGTNVIDLAAARERGIVVTNVPNYGAASVAQMTFALILELCAHTGAHSDGALAGRWSECPDFSYTDFPLIELEGLTLGLVGFGHIGRRVATIAKAFGMTVLVHTRSPLGQTEPGVQQVELESMLRESDVVTLHCPLTEVTRSLIDTRRLALMKPSAFLINTGRGPLVDEAALAEALNTGRIAGAALDVLSSEPPDACNPLLGARNCIITPHLSWATMAARGRLMKIAASNLRHFLEGAPNNTV